MDPDVDLRAELAASRLATVSVLAYFVLAVALYAVAIIYQTHARSVIHYELRTKTYNAVTLDRRTGLDTRQAIDKSVGVLELLCLLGLLRWMLCSARVAQRLHFPAQRSPAMAVGGWFVPVADLWFPYQSARDFTPPGNRARGLAGRWWGVSIARLVVGLSNQTILATQQIQGTHTTGVVVGFAVLGVLLDLSWLITFFDFRRSVTTCHAAAIRALSIAPISYVTAFTKNEKLHEPFVVVSRPRRTVEVEHLSVNEPVETHTPVGTTDIWLVMTFASSPSDSAARAGRG